MDKIQFDLSTLNELKKAYIVAIQNKQKTFMFKDHEFLVDYAKYLIQYLHNVLLGGK
jgi:hypothetical protein